LLSQVLFINFATLKKFIIISFLISYAFSTTELSQLLKVPGLVKHYIEHKEENRQITLLNFFLMHYVNGELHDKDHDHNMKLPFKSHDICLSLSHVDVVFQNFHYATIKPVVVTTSVFLSAEEYNWTSTFPSTIWQPPKSC
jgi:hypothetical protein